MQPQLMTVFLVLSACLRAQAADWTIEPGVRVGHIRKDTSERTLIKIYGRRNVKQTDVYLGEGFSESGTVIFPNDPTKTLSVLWKSTQTRIEPKSIRIQSTKTIWKTTTGITIGTTLKEIEKLNGKPFMLAGFDWDYSGTILHSNGGNLSELGVKDSYKGLRGRTLLLRLSPGPDSRGSSPEDGSVSGDHAFSSGHPAMQKINPRVYEISVDFN